MADINFAAVLKDRFLQKDCPENKPDIHEATFIAVCVEHTTWTNVEEAQEVLAALQSITTSEHLEYDEYGNHDTLVRAIIEVAKKVGNLEASDKKP